MDRIYIIGCSGFANEVTEYIKYNKNYMIAGYFDINKDNYDKYQFKAPFLGNEDAYSFDIGDGVLIAIADNRLRAITHDKLKKKGVHFPNMIHKDSFVSTQAKISEGAVICPFVTLTSNSTIGRNFHANIYSYIAHDCVIGNNVTFAPSVKCNGNVIVEDGVYIGTGVIIHQGKSSKPLTIGEGAVVAAGSVVTKSIHAKVTVFGNPAIEMTKENIKRRR